MSDFQSVLDRMQEGLAAEGVRALPGGGSRPDFIALAPSVGLVVADQLAQNEEPRAKFKELNHKLVALTGAAQGIAQIPVYRYLVDHAGFRAEPGKILELEEFETLGWLSKLPSAGLSSEILDDISSDIAPETSFRLESRTPVSDDGRDERNAERVVLDAQQALVAGRHVKDVLAIDGPPGSGKTLVLAARARWLSRHHPNWRIQILCFNKALVPYLRELVADIPEAHVETFGRFASQLGFRMAFKDELSAGRDLERAKMRGIPRCIDALLVDEAQDFYYSWLEFAHSTLVPNRGGMVIAGDSQQALYRESAVEQFAIEKSAETVRLHHPYRSTRQILDVVGAMEPSLRVDSSHLALEGPPVELIWADSLAEQANAVCFDLVALANAGWEWSDIAILMTQKFMIRPILGALHRSEIPFQLVTSDNVNELDRESDVVKVLTVHSAKGLEFSVVCLIGLDQLRTQAKPDRYGNLQDEQEIERLARLCLVGPTRAKDLLLITYTKSSEYLERLRGSDAPFRAWVWPQDYGLEG